MSGLNIVTYFGSFRFENLVHIFITTVPQILLAKREWSSCKCTLCGQFLQVGWRGFHVYSRRSSSVWKFNEFLISVYGTVEKWSYRSLCLFPLFLIIYSPRTQSSQYIWPQFVKENLFPPPGRTKQLLQWTQSAILFT